jgi:hypothetical protein
MSNEEPKLIVDEGWKNQVQREQQEALDKQANGEEDSDETTPSGDVGEMTPFDRLISGLGAQALMALGLIGAEGQQEVVVDLDFARNIIETVVLLREKTKGNLGAAEVRNLDDVIAELQRAFAIRVQQSQETTLNAHGPDLNQPDTFQ